MYANLSSAYRVPSLYQLFSQYGNLALSPETSRTYEAGFDLNFTSQINLSVSYFKRDIENVIDFGQVSPGKFGYLNQNMQSDKGYEVELSYKPTGLLNLNAYYAYVNGEVTTPVGTSLNLFRRPKNCHQIYRIPLSFLKIFVSVTSRIQRQSSKQSRGSHLNLTTLFTFINALLWKVVDLFH